MSVCTVVARNVHHGSYVTAHPSRWCQGALSVVCSMKSRIFMFLVKGHLAS